MPRKHHLIDITLLNQVRGWSVLIFTQVYPSTRCSFLFFLPSPITCLFFMRAFPLYSPSILHPNLPLVDLIDDLLDACPIQNLLEALWRAVNWDIIIRVSFPHKCGQLVRCKVFTVVVVAFFPNISSFVVGYLS